MKLVIPVALLAGAALYAGTRLAEDPALDNGLAPTSSGPEDPVRLLAGAGERGPSRSEGTNPDPAPVASTTPDEDLPLVAHYVPPDPTVPPVGCLRAEGDLYHVNHVNHLLHQALADGDSEQALVQAKRLGLYAIACILIEEGRPFRGPAEGSVDRSTWHSFTVNGTPVQFPRGEHPRFDEIYDACRAHRIQQALDPEAPGEFALTPGHLAAIQSLYEEADAYLSARIASNH